MQTTTNPRTIKKIQDLFASTLRSAIGVEVEITSRALSLWTISGAPDAVRVAVEYVQQNGLMQLEREIDFDEELGESFAYLDDRTAA